MTKTAGVAESASRDVSSLPCIVVHSLGHAEAAVRAAAETGRPIVLASAPGAASYAGAGWFRAVVDAAHAAAPEACFAALLDCGDEAGSAAAALAAGIGVRFTGSGSAAVRLADIARNRGVPFVSVMQMPAGQRPLDLADARDPAAACRDFLARNRPAG